MNIECIYCLKRAQSSNEHVIPELLGKFEPRLVIPIVCKKCNTHVFSPLETEFKEDSVEGIFTQMLDVHNRGGARMQNKNAEMTCFSNENDTFFNEIFPFLKWNGTEFKFVFKPQIKIRNYCEQNGGFAIFTLDRLKKYAKHDTAEYKKIKNRLQTTGKTNIAIFTEAKSQQDQKQNYETIETLKAYNLSPKIHNKKFTQISPSKTTHIIASSKVTKNISRVIAKIAFNYFAYCAQQSNQTEKIYHRNFNLIRNFVLGKAEIDHHSVVFNTKHPLTLSIPIKDTVHKISFYQEFTSQKIYSKVEFIKGGEYEILLGKSPYSVITTNISCSHLFNPINRKIATPDKTEMNIKDTFKLF